ncbi:hypothetical protein ACQP2F_27235 [Actinoplanes sp. CA-030573]|uniref:hypothetical protein n=1 Tax=Actinoplanes sp. CA-030573 TaxID=3239898 RepID=UPI003D8E2157
MADSRLHTLFESFSSAGADPALGECFADPFVVADTDGARPVSRAAFLQALPRRAQAFADAGVGRAALTSLTESRIDDNYLLIRTEWECARLAGGDPLRLASSFLVRDDGDRLEILLYLNHAGL